MQDLTPEFHWPYGWASGFKSKVLGKRQDLTPWFSLNRV